MVLKKGGRVAIRMDYDLKAKAEELAKSDRRSLSSWIEAVIAREIERIEARAAKKEERK